MINWQPIETAPKDGTEILLAHSEKVTTGSWDLDKYVRKPRPYWRTLFGVIAGKTWDRAQTWTHWHPIELPGDAPCKP